MEELKIEVLWIDDEPNDAFIDEAIEEGINITNADSVDKGIKLIKDSSRIWDAIILDANCNISGEEIEPSIFALYKVVKFLLKENITIPWFVYTAKGIDWSENLTNLINDEARTWDDRDYYQKPSQRFELFTNIKKAVEKRDLFLTKKKYAAVCSFYRESDLVDLLCDFEKDDFSTDTSVPNRVRQILEWVMRYFDENGLLPISFTGTNIGKCSSSLGEIPQLVPIHVARALHFCVEVCNNGSHADEIVSYIVSGEAPYLNKSIIFNLLNILQWCPSIKRYEKEELKKKVIQYQQETREEKEKRKKK
ncbi:MAG: hypothetical protein VZR53_07220 [Prevotella sp.]|nr:hypothetical protein [Prevotella sp.]